MVSAQHGLQQNKVSESHENYFVITIKQRRYTVGKMQYKRLRQDTEGGGALTFGPVRVPYTSILLLYDREVVGLSWLNCALRKVEY